MLLSLQETRKFCCRLCVEHSWHLSRGADQLPCISCACSSEVQHHGLIANNRILGHSKTITQRYSRREMQSLANALEVVGQNLDLSSLPKLMK